MQALPTNKSPHGTGDQLTNLWPGLYMHLIDKVS